MSNVAFPVIDPIATGKNILSLRKERGLTVRNLQEFFGFEEPQAIYRWQYGKTLSSVDNLYALSAILDVPMERILVTATYGNLVQMEKHQELPAAYVFIQLIHEEVRIDNLKERCKIIKSASLFWFSYYWVLRVFNKLLLSKN